MSVSLFEKYGGMSALYPIVISFYDAVQDSEIVGPRFDNINMENLIEHQTRFVASLMGGPVIENDERLIQVHKNLQISEAEWAEVVTLFVQSLEDGGVESEDIDAIVALIASKKPLIVADEHSQSKAS